MKEEIKKEMPVSAKEPGMLKNYEYKIESKSVNYDEYLELLKTVQINDELI